MNDSDLGILEYWDKYKEDIATERNWGKKAHKGTIWGRSETMNAYDKKLEQLATYLPNSISETTYADIHQAMRNVRRAGSSRSSGKPYSPKTMRTTLSALADLYKFAYNRGDAYNVLAFFSSRRKQDDNLLHFIESSIEDPDPVDRIEELLEDTPPRLRSLTIFQTERLAHLLIHGSECTGQHIGIALILYCGLRPAECRGLIWQDVQQFMDHPGRYYLALHQIRDRNGNITEHMKTNNAYRKIPIHIELLDFLLRRMKLVKDACGDAYLSYPICCLGNSFDEPCRDYHLANTASALFERIRVSSDIMFSYQMEQCLDAMRPHGAKKSSSSNEQDLLTLYVLRRNFWTMMSSSTTLTDLEKRYVMGHSMSIAKTDYRPSYNDENRLWRICQKMDRSIFSQELHRGHITQSLDPCEITYLLDNGVSLLDIPNELLLQGGTVHINVNTLTPGDDITIQYPEAKTPFGKICNVRSTACPMALNAESSINCELDNWNANNTIRKLSDPSANHMDGLLDEGKII